jgi:hypothetical protein
MDIGAAIAQGAANPVLLVGTALLLGALHGLEPGHSKTMMAAFVIAVRGTVWQAVLLGLSAAVSHSIIVWVLALAALAYGPSRPKTSDRMSLLRSFAELCRMMKGPTRRTREVAASPQTLGVAASERISFSQHLRENMIAALASVSESPLRKSAPYGAPRPSVG